MKSSTEFSQDLTQIDQTVSTQPQPVKIENAKTLTFKKLRGGALFVVGFLLSPLCWWNDLIFNLPFAYLFGYLCHLIYSDWFIPATIVGYWLSNIIGVLMMQAGALDVLQKSTQERNFKKELISGIISSTAYTLVILLLVQLKIFDTPALFNENNFINLSSLLPH
jgi:hypothetical protein